MEMQGAPVTLHVTSPVSWLSSVMAFVAVIVPLILAALAALAQIVKDASNNQLQRAIALGVVMTGNLLAGQNESLLPE